MNGWLVHSGPGNKVDQLSEKGQFPPRGPLQNYRWGFPVSVTDLSGPNKPSKVGQSKTKPHKVTLTQIKGGPLQFLAVKSGEPMCL